MADRMKNNKISIFYKLQIFLAFAAVAAVLLPVFLNDSHWPVFARDYLEANGEEQTGAANIVSSIYLGYRAYDTLGETIVLLVAVSGTIGIISFTGKNLATGYNEDDFEGGNRKNRKRTVLMEVVTGKLGPVILIFGLYVMLFGHMSPGGGFQGGVVIASGIIFISLGTGGSENNILSHSGVLAKIEAVSFLLLVLASAIGLITGIGFFANPFNGNPIPPVGYIILLNAMIGLKVGAGIAYMSVAMLGDTDL
ncbi:MAG: hypothetical protein JEZ04_15650 [Spirochaetales bacterium]|nr:hypothetical protein [Spirochaetales bacterium]